MITYELFIAFKKHMFLTLYFLLQNKVYYKQGIH